jgi:hypothetical protein
MRPATPDDFLKIYYNLFKNGDSQEISTLQKEAAEYSAEDEAKKTQLTSHLISLLAGEPGDTVYFTPEQLEAIHVSMLFNQNCFLLSPIDIEESRRW